MENDMDRTTHQDMGSNPTGKEESNNHTDNKKEQHSHGIPTWEKDKHPTQEMDLRKDQESKKCTWVALMQPNGTTWNRNSINTSNIGMDRKTTWTIPNKLGQHPAIIGSTWI